MNHILALLDRPRPRSLGITPLVIEDEDKIIVSGLADASTHRGRYLSRADVEELIRVGHAMQAGAHSPESLSRRHVALWIGAEFEEASRKRGLPLPPLPSKTHNAEGGRFAVGESPDLYAYLDAWTNIAFSRYLSQTTESAKRSISDLMRWVLPSDPRTLAASWDSAVDRSRELQLQYHFFGTHLKIGEWELLLQETISNHQDPMGDISVVAFVGGSASHRTEVANRFAALAASRFTSFADTIKHRLSLNSATTTEKWILMEEGQKLVESAPLAMALDVLRPAAETSQQKVVVDSVRHQEILDSITWLTPKPVYVVSVVSPLEQRRRELRKRGLNPEEVLSHPTETQIERLSERANFTVNTAGEWDPQLISLSKKIKELHAT